uniref:UPAR/Ly6 domain-containing protein n=1 Tax=Amphilophus citrinellus TaxID=61819 RepID=A0A3Q0RMD2_AMPCI
MPTVIKADLFLLPGEALKCNCGGSHYCPTSVETCVGSNNVCASVIIYAGTPKYFQGCMNSPDCRIMNHPGISSATCCATDLCNR